MSTKTSNQEQLGSYPYDGSAAVGSKQVSNRDSNSAAFSITTLFQITTACCLFFACLQISPLLAIVLTVIFTPAIIRTGVIAELHWRTNQSFGWRTRLQYFFSSIGVVFAIAAAASAVFAMSAMLFAMMGMAFNSIVGDQHLNFEAAVVGSAGGMILGMAAAILTMAYVGIKMWLPRELVGEN